MGHEYDMIDRSRTNELDIDRWKRLLTMQRRAYKMYLNFIESELERLDRERLERIEEKERP